MAWTNRLCSDRFGPTALPDESKAPHSNFTAAYRAEP